MPVLWELMIPQWELFECFILWKVFECFVLQLTIWNNGNEFLHVFCDVILPDRQETV